MTQPLLDLLPRLGRVMLLVVAAVLLLLMQTSHSPSASLADVCDSAGRLATPLANLSYLAPLGQQVQRAACAHLRTRQTARVRQWDSSLEKSLGSSITAVQSWLAREPSIKAGSGWQAMEQWIATVAEELAAQELQALLAPILEKRWVSTAKAGVLSGISVRHDAGPGPQGSRTTLLTDLASRALAANLRAGRVQQAEQFYELMHSYEEGPGNYPLRWFYDTDVYHTSAQPWPGLSVLNSPDPATLLPANTADSLVESLRGIADEASSAMVGDGGQHKEILPMFTAAAGWGEICKAARSVAVVCTTLQSIFSGKMRTESGPIARVVQQGILDADVELIALVEINSSKSVPLRSVSSLGSQHRDLRVNVLAPMCTSALSVSVAGSPPTAVPGFSLFAFEDRAEFEIEISDPDARGSVCVALVVGVLHPDAVAALENEMFPSPHQVLRYAIDGANRSHTEPLLPWQEFSKTMTSALVLASYYGYSGAVAALIDAGAALDALHLGHTGAVHAACLGVTNVGDRTQRHPDRVSKALGILELLADRGADLTMAGQHGTPEQLAQRLRIPELSAGIAKLMNEMSNRSGRSNDGDRDGTSRRGSHTGRKSKRAAGNRKARISGKQEL